MLREFARNWLPLLFNAFIATDSQERNSYAAAIAAYATIAEAATLSHFFREVIKKLLKVVYLNHAGTIKALLLLYCHPLYIVMPFGVFRCQRSVSEDVCATVLAYNCNS